ncbi:hypothetical protein [Lacticaseibacillus zhaodongensis]|uniref:hypothetical protein n=1 Tax=Lacticaseibacillus zhaodongensis TaxID=2668065 RepID=UPI0012D349B2|nr:hypothetical protein [Lacticaseibacillus zhaodongensis]
MVRSFARVAIGAALVLVLGGCGQQSAKTAQSASAVKTQKRAKASYKHPKTVASSKSGSVKQASSQSSSASSASSQAAQSSAQSSTSSSSSATERVDAKTAGIFLCMY